jgi:WD40 repeat protein
LPVAHQQQLLQQHPVHAQQGAVASSAAAAAVAADSTPVVLHATATLWGHTARVWDLAFLQSDQQSGTAAQAGALVKEAPDSNSSSSSTSTSTSSSSSSRLLVATGSEDCSCCLWDVATGQQAAVLKVWGGSSHTSAAFALCLLLCVSHVVQTVAGQRLQ